MSSSARADDGYLSIGGNPHLMGPHSTVSMQSEAVDVDIRENNVTVDCQFVFKNTGEACSVRMGFPDQGTTEQRDPKHPQGSFKSYKSYVNGIEIPTETVSGAGKKYEIWHAKVVDFPANSILRVHDVYSDIEGGFQIPPDGCAHFFSYVLHTASSWSGKIGVGDVRITFNSHDGPFHAVSARDVPGANLRKFLRKAPTGTILYSGPGHPEVEGKTLKFHFENLRPNDGSDIVLMYDYQKNLPEK